MGTKLDLLINENYSKLNEIDLHILNFMTECQIFVI